MGVLAVSSPNFWWRASATTVGQWVTVDPDIDDGKIRWRDRDAQRWDLIAATVAAVGDVLASGQWTPQSSSGIYADVGVAAYPGQLTAVERKIVGAWFSAAEPVRVDPWWDELSNGRHRLWQTLPFFGDSLVPILGDALGYADAANTAQMGPNWPKTYSGQLLELDASAAFDSTDPMNVVFRRSMEEAAAGRLPSPV